MSTITVEFESPESGAYIHESTDKITLKFSDKDGDPYTLVVHKVYAEALGADQLEFDLTYPDGQTTTMESIWLSDVINGADDADE